MAQPPLSQSIRRLELDLGVDLFDRSRRGVEMTAAGRIFLVEARRTLAQAALARKLALREAAKVPEVSVSFVGPALFRVLPDLLVRYRTEPPDIHVRLHERSSPEQLASIVAGDFDVGFVTAAGTARGSGCETLMVERAPFVAAVPADWPIAAHDRVTLAQLAEQPFITPPPQYALQSSEVLGVFKAAGVMPQIAQEAIQTTTTISLVGAGLGCSLVVGTAALMPTRNVRFLPLADAGAVPPWEMMMTWQPDHIGPLAAGFIEFTRRHVEARPHLIDPGAALR